MHNTYLKIIEKFKHFLSSIFAKNHPKRYKKPKFSYRKHKPCISQSICIAKLYINATNIKKSIDCPRISSNLISTPSKTNVNSCHHHRNWRNPCLVIKRSTVQWIASKYGTYPTTTQYPNCSTFSSVQNTK